jgi:2-phospho-L-lactate guanylyltransferase
VVCDSQEVAAWAAGDGAGVIWRPGPGLNEAVTAAVDVLTTSGHDQVIVAHGDLPLAADLGWVGDFDGVTIVRDRRGDGTNVLSVPTGTGFGFAYGPGSALRHRAEAERIGLAVRVVDDERLGWDVDTPDDLAVFDSLLSSPGCRDGRSDPVAG